MPTAPVLASEQGNAKLPPLVKAANTAARHAAIRMDCAGAVINDMRLQQPAVHVQ